MFPFWDLAIAPVLEAARAKTVVEIGALGGETTTRVLDALGPEAELHVVDPLPQFDPAEHEERFGGRYVFHRDLSLRALPAIPPADVALVDGDHNWYTVYNELKLLAATARAAGRPMPVLLMHDVGWPYGRRDLYYAPETIPDDYRQPYARRGIGRRRRTLLEEGGLNAQLHNAIEEGGPRNGVLTALEDFRLEHGEPLRVVILPVYFGLAVVAEEARLAAEPALAAVFDRLESAEGRREQAALADTLWRGSLVKGQERRANAGRADADRYLDLLKASLLDEHYVENELRVQYLAQCAAKGTKPEPRVLRHPELRMRNELERLVARRRNGRVKGDGSERRPYFPYTEMGRTRIDHLARCLDVVAAEDVAGDLVECGTGRGGGAILLRGHLEARGDDARTVWVADRFGAGEEKGGGDARRYHPMTADINAVRSGFERFGLLDERVRFLQGDLPDALADAPIETIALLRIGESLDASPAEVLEQLYARVAPGGFVVVEDAGAVARREDVEAFRARHGVTEALERVDGGAIAWRKLGEAATGEGADPAAAPLRRTPLAPPLPTDHADLSVVVVFHDMRREAERTLHSLSRAYQEGVEDVDYEVIAVENGSAPGQRLGEDFVRGFGPQFRYIDLGAEAHPSPARALNRGIAAARGRDLALMIDGAHVLSPGVLRHGLTGLDLHRPAVVATRLMYLGPDLQFDAVADGYDQAYEDRLFESIGWPARGYELFSIAHFIGDGDWFDAYGESNCLFVPRALLEQAGGLDESFTLPGGEFANLDLFERLATTPGVNAVAILGEASFHQVHGGSTTNVDDGPERRRRIEHYRARYRELRGRPFVAPSGRTHYVGHLDRRSLRTRARWRPPSPALRAGGADPRPGPPEEPALMQAELREAYVDAYWHSLGWKETRWFGEPVRRSAADLVALQELVASGRPARVVVVGDGDGELTAFLRSVCAIAGVGEVVSAAGPEDAEAITAARDAADALVVLAGPASRDETVARFDAFAPLVAVGGHVVVESTIVGGHPVWPEFGHGPAEAVRFVLHRDERFTADRALERFGPSFNHGGYLLRVRA